MAYSVPNVIRVNRGKLSLDGLAEKAFELQGDRIVIIDRWTEGFADISFFRIGDSGSLLSPMQIYAPSVRLRREFEARAERIRSLAVTIPFEDSLATSQLAHSIGDFFDLPVFMGQETVSRFSAIMQISSEAWNRFQITFLLPSLVEVGPRINVSKVVWSE